jgi:hypothetical protein
MPASGHVKVRRLILEKVVEEWHGDKGGDEAKESFQSYSRLTSALGLASVLTRGSTLYRVMIFSSTTY